MGKRKLVRSGASSFNIAVPIDWIRRNKLDKGSEVSVEENEIGDLVIHIPKDRIFIQQSHHTIKINENNEKVLYWEIVRAYLRNYTNINLEGNNVSKTALPTIKRLDSFVGLDIIEQTRDVIVLKNFSVYDTDSSPYYLLKKIDVGVRAMFEAINDFFEQGFYHEDVLELQSQHEYNERIYLFSLKLINAIVDNPSLMRVFKTDYRQLMKELSIVAALKQISFYLSKIGSLLIAIEHKSKRGKIARDIISTLIQKYKVVVTLPKNPLSKELLVSLDQSKNHINKWQSGLGQIKSQPITELVIYCISINSVLDQLSLELMN